MELGYISKAIDIDKENEISNHQYNKMRRKHRKKTYQACQGRPRFRL